MLHMQHANATRYTIVHFVTDGHAQVAHCFGLFADKQQAFGYAHACAAAHVAQGFGLEADIEVREADLSVLVADEFSFFVVMLPSPQMQHYTKGELRVYADATCEDYTDVRQSIGHAHELADAALARRVCFSSDAIVRP